VIRIIVTGGTFDKTYDEINGRLSFGTTHLPEMLRLGRSRVETTIETVMMIDSLDMTEADRARIAERCRRCPESRIVITHGTDTMVETARVIALSWGPPSLGAVAASAAEAAGGAGAEITPDKTVVLTGAMVPYAFGSSDGLFNLGSALSCAEVLPPGVYIAMNGQHFVWNRVRKNRDTGVFEGM